MPRANARQAAFARGNSRPSPRPSRRRPTAGTSAFRRRLVETTGPRWSWARPRKRPRPGTRATAGSGTQRWWRAGERRSRARRERPVRRLGPHRSRNRRPADRARNRAADSGRSRRTGPTRTRRPGCRGRTANIPSLPCGSMTSTTVQPAARAAETAQRRRKTLAPGRTQKDPVIEQHNQRRRNGRFFAAHRQGARARRGRIPKRRPPARRSTDDAIQRQQVEEPASTSVRWIV